jgi:hypothetical protein
VRSKNRPNPIEHIRKYPAIIKENQEERAWKPGMSGNPKGKPPKEFSICTQLQQIGGRQLTPAMVRMLEKEFPGEAFDGMNYMQAMMMRVFRKAIDGDNGALEFYADRTEGRVTNSIKIEAPERTQLSDEEKALIADRLGIK